MLQWTSLQQERCRQMAGAINRYFNLRHTLNRDITARKMSSDTPSPAQRLVAPVATEHAVGCPHGARRGRRPTLISIPGLILKHGLFLGRFRLVGVLDCVLAQAHRKSKLTT